ncbi:kinase-like domain-containing protein, partial [Dissophora ornata]
MSEVPTDGFPDSWGRLGEIPLPTLDTMVGTGMSGEVYLWNKDGIQMAVKRIRVLNGNAADIARELNIVSQLAHKHIIQCYGVDRDANYVSIVTDYAEGGNLRDAVSRLDWENKKRIVAEVALGLGYLHSQGIVHRDVKGLNILLSKHDQAKLCDFGIAKTMASATCASTFIRKGTLKWMAPELMRARPMYSTKSDIFALGVVMQELVLKDGAPLDYKAMMERCLDEDPEKRPTIEEIVGAFSVVRDVQDIAGESDQVKKEQKTSAEEELQLGLRFHIGNGVDSNYAEAAERYRSAANMGNMKAQYLLGDLYRTGNGVPRDHSKAAELFQKAADQGFALAQWELGISYEHGGRGVPQDYRRAFDLYQAAANQGHNPSCVNLAKMYKNGLGAEKNIEEAMRWYREAAERGCAKAQVSIAALYHDGHGIQSEVLKAKIGLDDVVVKVFLNPNHEDSKREVEIIKQLRNRHIVQFYHLEQHMLVMEYVEGGSLSNAILEGSIQDWETKTRIAKQVSLGLVYLHGQDIIHCDIKSANILLTECGDAKICDFGRARTVGQSGGDGTLPWMAPELLLEPPQYSCKSDIYALGMVMWEMASECTQPYQEHTRDSMSFCILKGYTEDIPDNTPEVYKAFINKCWNQEPTERPTAADMLPEAENTSHDHDHDVGNLRVQGEEQFEDLEFLPKKARNRYPNVRCDLGNMYYHGSGLKKNYAKALDWYLKADDAGEVDAKHAIGTMYGKGHGVVKDFGKAIEWYLKASDAGHPQAKFEIGNIYANGEGVEQDWAKAMEWNLKASDAGVAKAKASIGRMYRFGHGVRQDYDKALEWWLKASEAKNSYAMLNIGNMYHEGHGVEQDYAKAMEWFLKASEAGEVKATASIGEMYSLGRGVEQDYDKAMEWWLKASKAGDSYANLNIGTIYANGYGVKQNYVEAMEWFLKASDAGVAKANTPIGQMYRLGHGVGRDYAKAMEWFLKANDAGDLNAKFNIGNMYYNGNGVEQDYTKAMEWFLMASDAGDTNAAFRIGRLYFQGHGVEQDYAKAM